MDNKQLIAMAFGIAAVGAVPEAVSAGQESHFSELWGASAGPPLAACLISPMPAITWERSPSRTYRCGAT